MMHSRRFSEMPKTSILHADPRGAGSTRSSATRRSRCRQNARRELALEDDALNAICERKQTVPQNPASCIPDSMTLRTMLDQLEPKHRASLLLAIIDGRTHQEIAEYLRVPVGTVKAWIRRELVAMRRQIE